MRDNRRYQCVQLLPQVAGYCSAPAVSYELIIYL